MRPRPCIAKLCALLAALLAMQISAAAQADRWQQLNSQAVQLQKQGKNAEAYPIAQEAARVAEAAFGEEKVFTAVALNRLGSIETALAKYSDAELHFKRALKIGEKLLGPDDKGLAAMLSNLAAVYDDEGRYAEAEPLYKRALAIAEKAKGQNDAGLATDINNLAMLYMHQARYAEAEPLFKRAQSIDEKVLGPGSAGYATDLQNMATLYASLGRYAESEALYRRAMDIDLKTLGRNSPSVATNLEGVAHLYEMEGRYAPAEPILKGALAIYQQAYGPEHPAVATVLYDIGLLYEYQGRHAEAEPQIKKALAIDEKILGPDKQEVAAILAGLGMVYRAEGKYKDAEIVEKRSLEIDEKTLGPEHPTTGAALNLLGALYQSEGRYADAEPLYARFLGIIVKALGPENPGVAAGLNNFASVLTKMGLFAQAEPSFKRAIAIEEKTLGPDHPDLAGSLVNLAMMYVAQGRYSDAAPLFERALDIIHRRFQYGFAYMSEKDRLQFLATVQYIFPGYFSFSFAQREHDPSVAARMYDVILWEKGAIGTSVAALRAQVAATGDPEALKLLDDLTAKKSEASQLASARAPGWEAEQSRVNAEANSLEQKLARRVSSLGEKDTLARATWQDVRKDLRPEEAAVEYVRYQFHDGKAFTNNYRYIALVVTPKSTLPSLVSLGDARKLESAPMADYRAAVGRTRGVAPKAPAQAQQGATNPNSSAAYDAFWKPLESALGGATRIYVSTDGVLNQIPMGLFADADGKLLLEKYDLRPVNSTKDLLRTQHPAPAKTAVLLGNPKFDLSETDARAMLAKLDAGDSRQPQYATATAPASHPETATRSREAQAGPLPPLPATQVEIDAVGKLLGGAGWKVEPFTRDAALEEVLDRQRSPRLLHVATHGFFLSDQDLARSKKDSADQSLGAEDPMLRSGLFFAGADRAESGAAPISGLEDGVLTAYEAAQLDLQGTELVVLSACETGLGEQQNGEGVFGLRRGLQEAGAESILMSMWSVPDRETQELMALFYQNWLSGADKHEALRQAQIKEREVVRQRYSKDLPFYWGAFVLVGR